MSTSIAPAIRDLLRFTRTHLRHHEALMRATGGHFNLFQILGIGHYEVRTHSPILAELLNPQGRHGQGDVFLRLFLSMLTIEDTCFDATSTRAVSEHYIGPVKETTGGRIDIMIEDTSDRPRKEGEARRIIIENKIYAGDQENQLIRYRSFDPVARLIYLTLFGDEASEFSAKGLQPEDYTKISYEKEIRAWLMACRKEAACLPGIREIISQYIHLIEELTHQSTTKQMNENLINEITSDKETLSAFFELSRLQWDVKMALISKLDEDLDAIAKRLSLVRDGRCVDMGGKEGSIGFTNNCLKSLGVAIMFQFERPAYQELFFTFYVGSTCENMMIGNALKNAVSEIYRSVESSPGCPAYAYFEPPYRNWGDEAFEGIRSGDLTKNIQTKLETLTEIARQVCATHPAAQTSLGPTEL